MHHDSRRTSIGGACGVAAALTFLIVALASRIVAQQQTPPTWNSVYSTAQAKRGEGLYARNCVQCHGQDLLGGERAPAVAGPALAARWANRPLGELLNYMQTQMPLNSPGGLTRQQNADILAFMLQRAGAMAGATDLWIDGPGGKAPPRRSREYGMVATPSTQRAEAFYTLEQAERGRVAFNRYCAYCHTVDPKLSTPKDLVQPLPSTFGGHFIERVVNGKRVYPTALALFSKLQSMPGADTRAITDQQRVDIMAYILQTNGLPAGDREIPLNTDAMRLMMLNEPGFERIFNGKDFSGWNMFLGFRCQSGPEGCAKYEPGEVLSVEREMIVCECHVHGHLYTDKKYKNFTLRFETRFERPAYYAPEDDDELFSGGNGYFIHFNPDNPELPRGLEVEGRHRDILQFVVTNRPQEEDGAIMDLAAKRRAIRPLGMWNTIEISSINGHVTTKLNDIPVSSLKMNTYTHAGHIMFQTQGAKIYWRNIRIRVWPDDAR